MRRTLFVAIKSSRTLGDLSRHIYVWIDVFATLQSNLQFWASRVVSVLYKYQSGLTPFIFLGPGTASCLLVLIFNGKPIFASYILRKNLVSHQTSTIIVFFSIHLRRINLNLSNIEIKDNGLNSSLVVLFAHQDFSVPSTVYPSPIFLSNCFS